MYISTKVPLNRSPSFLPEILDEAQPHNDGSRCSTFHQYGHSIPYKINNHHLSISCNTLLHTTLLSTQSYRLQNYEPTCATGQVYVSQAEEIYLVTHTQVTNSISMSKLLQ